MPAIDLRRALMDWVREQQDFGDLPLPDGVQRKRLFALDPANLAALRASVSSPATPAAPAPHTPSPPRTPAAPAAAGKPSAAPVAKTAPPAAPAQGLASGPALADLKPTHGTLEELRSSFADCRLCGIAAARQNLVFGVGNPAADLVIVGEAPGADEDRLGDPFVGAAGQLLDKILAAIGFAREDVYICNILKCRPPNNRDPQPDEVHNCSPFLLQQLALLQPKLLLAVGRIAGKTLLGVESTLTEMRRTTHEFRGVPLVVTYHPAALLRNPHWKRGCWEDVQKAATLLRERGGKPGSLAPTS